MSLRNRIITLSTRTKLNPRDYVHVTVEVISLARRLAWQQLDAEKDLKGN